MRLLVISCALLLTGCFPKAVEVVKPGPTVPAAMLQPCAGWGGGKIVTEGDVAAAWAADHFGLRCANGRLAAVDKALNG